MAAQGAARQYCNRDRPHASLLRRDVSRTGFRRLADVSDAVRCAAPRLTLGGLLARRSTILASDAEKREPDDTQDQEREPRRGCQQRENRRSRLGLARLGRGFNDLTVSFRCHSDLFAQVPVIPAIAAPLRGGPTHDPERCSEPVDPSAPRSHRAKPAQGEATVNAVAKFTRPRCFKLGFPVLSLTVPSVA